MAVDGWAVAFRKLVQREGAWAGFGPAQSPIRCTKCISPPSVPTLYYSMWHYKRIAGLPKPASKPDPTRNPRVGSGRRYRMSGRVG